MTKHYADNYEEITGLTRDEEVAVETPAEQVVISEPETKDITADSNDVHTA